MYRVESLSQISLLSAFDLTVVLIGPPPCVPCIRPENEFLYYAVLSPIHAKDNDYYKVCVHAYCNPHIPRYLAL